MMWKKTPSFISNLSLLTTASALLFTACSSNQHNPPPQPALQPPPVLVPPNTVPPYSGYNPGANGVATNAFAPPANEDSVSYRGYSAQEKVWIQPAEGIYSGTLYLRNSNENLQHDKNRGDRGNSPERLQQPFSLIFASISLNANRYDPYVTFHSTGRIGEIHFSRYVEFQSYDQENLNPRQNRIHFYQSSSPFSYSGYSQSFFQGGYSAGTLSYENAPQEIFLSHTVSIPQLNSPDNMDDAIFRIKLSVVFRPNPSIDPVANPQAFSNGANRIADLHRTKIELLACDSFEDTECNERLPQGVSLCMSNNCSGKSSKLR